MGYLGKKKIRRKIMARAKNLKSYKCKHVGCRDNISDYVNIEAFDPKDAAMIFAEEYGVEDGEIVHVWQFGDYRIGVIMEPIVSATKL